MNFDSHAERVSAAAVDLVNALTPGMERGRPIPPLDRRQRRARAESVTRSALTDAEAVDLELAATQLRPVFEAVEGRHVDRAVETVNGLIERYQPVPILARHDGEPWHLHFRSMAAGLPEGWAAGCSVALAYVLGSAARERLGVCSARSCDRVFIDQSRNGSRRFCSTACQNRTKSAAFRARRSEATPTR